MRTEHSTRSRDLTAGGLCVAAGIVVLIEAGKYTIGSFEHVGPGLYPAILGSLLTVVGFAIAASAVLTAPTVEEAEDVGGAPDWRGWSCIVLGVALFIVFAGWTGLAPAIFACVLASAMGDRTTSLRGALVMAACMCIAGTVLFGYLLGINMPLWQWPGTS